VSLTESDIVEITKAAVSATLATLNAQKEPQQPPAGESPRQTSPSAKEKDPAQMTWLERITHGLNKSRPGRSGDGKSERPIEVPAQVGTAPVETTSYAQPQPGISVSLLPNGMVQTVDRANSPLQNITQGLNKSKPFHRVPDRYM
jgi:hypothetical protein